MPRPRTILVPLVLAACVVVPAAACAQRDTLPAGDVGEDFDALWTYVRDNYRCGLCLHKRTCSGSKWGGT